MKFMDENTDLAKHIVTLKWYKGELSSLGSKMEEDDFSMLILSTLPDSWDNFNEAYLGAHTDTTVSINTQELIKILLDEEKRRKLRSSDTILLSQQQRKGKRPAGNGQSNAKHSDKSRVICHNCGKAGHYARDCWAKGGGKEGQGPSRSKSGRPQQSASAYQADDHEPYADDFGAMFTAIADVMHADTTPSDWIADTGATSHIVPTREMFSDYAKVPGDSVVRGVGTTAKVARKGTIKLRFDLGQNKSVVHTLTDVLHIPSAPSYLLSIPKFTEAVSGHADFRQGKVHLYNKNGNLLGTGDKSRGLYIMNAKSALMEERAFLAKSGRAAPWETWHQRFGHIGISGLKQMHAKKMATGFDVDVNGPAPPECASCISAKMTR